MTIDRRSFVRGSLAAALAGGVGSPLLAACGSDGSSATADTTDGTAGASTPPTPVRMTAMMPFPLHLAAMKKGMDTVADIAAFTELVPEIREQWDLPQLDNLLVNVPERWEEGVEQFAELEIVPAGTDPTQFYTDDLLEEALS
jgi:hypothetical protein